MKLFLDASTLLAACGSTGGSSRAIFQMGGEFYGLQVRMPFEFLEQERAAGRLRIAGP